MKGVEVWTLIGILAVIGIVVWRGGMTDNEGMTLAVLAAQLVVFIQQRKLMAQQLKVSAESEKRAQRHDRLAVRPYLDFQTTGGNGKIKVVLENHGIGPAVNVVLHVLVDGESVAAEPNRWEEWPKPLLKALDIKQLDLVAGADQKGYLTMPSATLRPAATIDVIDFHFGPNVDLTKLRSRLRLSATYQSIYKGEDEDFTAEMVWSGKPLAVSTG
jgi:hypothetical protein